MKLLVSVRSPEEAIAALEGGADLIDVKEPNRGSLGKADDNAIAEIVKIVNGRRPVSAAMGELADANSVPSGFALTYLKWGLAGCAEFPWRERLLELRESTPAIVVPCAYADWEKADSPAVDEVQEFVVEHRFRVLLIDTWCKDGSNLFHWIDTPTIHKVIEKGRSDGVEIALAGSLGLNQLSILRMLKPNWVAIRGAACLGGIRKGSIDRRQVQVVKWAMALSLEK